MAFRNEKMIREVWFPNHRAERRSLVSGTITQEEIVWRNPESVHYYTHYIVRYNTLIVIGDIGDAVYRWSDRITFEWLANCGIDYFHGKCQASPHGRSYDWNEWDADEAETFIRTFVDDSEEEGVKEAMEEAIEYCSLRDSFHHWLHDGEASVKVFGDDYWEYSNIGDVIPIRCEGHLLGIKMAMEQLNAESKDERTRG